MALDLQEQWVRGLTEFRYAATDEQFASLCSAVGRSDWATDPDLSDAGRARAHHAPA